jgi:hypothetical protein
MLASLQVKTKQDLHKGILHAHLCKEEQMHFQSDTKLPEVQKMKTRELCHR